MSTLPAQTLSEVIEGLVQLQKVYDLRGQDPKVNILIENELREISRIVGTNLGVVLWWRDPEVKP